MEHGFDWWNVLGGLHIQVGPLGLEELKPVLSSLVTVMIVLLGAVIAGGHFANREKALVPEAGISTSSIFDGMLDGVIGFIRQLIGPDYRRYLPLIGTLALFILVSNLTGQIPGFRPATDSLSITLACGLISFVVYNYHGVREHGVAAYLKHFMGPMIWLAPLMFPIEIISHCARPFSLAIRLFGNIFAGHMVLGIFLGMGFAAFLLPIPIMLLELMVAFIQTAIFCILTTVYISMAVAHESHGGEDHGAHH
ncbi:MAG: ATP synthase subunit a [Myxococcota bacterium]|nr:ATP synthase subunit a [Myxococcota bacterium]